MKQLICILLLAALLLPGCANQEPEYVAPVNFYYPKTTVTYFTADGVISKEIREAQGYGQDYAQILALYLQGPESDGLQQIFPQDVTLIQLDLSSEGATVVLNDAMAQLSGVDLSIACACLTATVCELTGVQAVTIQAQSQLLDGSKTITMTRDQVLLLDSNMTPVDNN